MPEIFKAFGLAKLADPAKARRADVLRQGLVAFQLLAGKRGNYWPIWRSCQGVFKLGA